MKDYKLFWENMPTSAEEAQEAVHHLLENTPDSNVYGRMIEAAAFGLTIEAFLNSTKEVIVNSALSEELH